MSSDLAIAVHGISKAYSIYERPHDRLKQMLWRGRRKFYDEFWALRDVHFDVRRGETVGIVGRNGSGKSTLLQIICGTVTPTTGTVYRHGRISALLELGSGFNPEFTGRENVYLNGSVLGLTRQQIDDRFDKIAGFADIGPFIDSPVKHYSSGMFARLAFAVAVNVSPEILIVDEILAVGDTAFQRRCLEKFYEIRDNGCSILFVSHDQYQVKSICHRAVYLEKGVQRMFGAAGVVIDQYMIDTEAALAQTNPAIATGGAAVTAVMSSGDRVTNAIDVATSAEPVDQSQQPERSPEQRRPATLDQQAQAANARSESEIFRITDVRLFDADGRSVDRVQSGQDVTLRMDFEAVVPQLPDSISFVFNLYRHDDFYICGTTTLMDGFKPHPSGRSGSVSIQFPRLPLLSGKYKWRVAINDHRGFVVLAEAKHVCEFQVSDAFDSVGLINLPRQWKFEIRDRAVGTQGSNQ